MYNDPIVEEVRRARDSYAREFNYDLDAICRDLQEKQSRGKRAVVSFPPRRVKTKLQRPNTLAFNTS